jgi:hypothetical protein
VALREQCTRVLAAAHEAGQLALYGGPALHRFAPNEIYFNAVRVRANGTLPEDWTRVEQQGRQDAWTMFRLFKAHLPDFKDAYFFQSGPVAGARETRRIIGDYVLTADDIRAGRRHEDVVVLGAGRFDRHPIFPVGQHETHVVPPYDIAYRTLLPQGVENLLVAGRCHSATSEALASSRLTATAMGMGQAAGVAAALAARGNGLARDVPPAELQDRLRAQDAILESEATAVGYVETR